MILKLGIDHQGLKVYKVYRNDNPGKTYFTAKTNLVEIAYWSSAKVVKIVLAMVRHL